SCFFFQAEDGIRDKLVTGVQTCALPISFFDFDNDGDQDILLINSTSWPNNSATFAPTPCALYENLGGGKFKNVTAGSGLEQPIRSEERRVGKERRPQRAEEE